MIERRLLTERMAAALKAGLERDGMNPDNQVSLKLLGGIHHRMEGDAEYPVIIGEQRTGIQVDLILVAGNINYAYPLTMPQAEFETVELNKSQEIGEAKTEPKKEPKKEKLIPFTPGVETKPGVDRTAVKEAYQEKGVVQIKVDGFFYPAANYAPQINTNAYVAISETVLAHILAFAAAEKGLDLIKSKSESKENRGSGGLLSRRAFLKLGAYSLGGLVSSMALNELMLNTDILNRREINPTLGRAAHDLLFTLPEESLKLINERYHYLYKSTMTFRNLNMALNIIHSLVALSHSDFRFNSQEEALSWFGIMHLGIPGKILEGSATVSRELTGTLKEMVSYYAQKISESESREKRGMYLADFFYIVSDISPPVANRPIEVKPGVKLPPTGIDCLWDAMAEAGTELRGEPETNLAFQMMLDGLLTIHAQAADGLAGIVADEYRLDSATRGRTHYTNIWRFNGYENYELLLPRHRAISSEIQGKGYQRAVIRQNGEIYLTDLSATGGLRVQHPINDEILFAMPSAANLHELVRQPQVESVRWV